MLPDRVSNPGPLTYESGALQIVLHGPAALPRTCFHGSIGVRAIEVLLYYYYYSAIAISYFTVFDTFIAVILV